MDDFKEATVNCALLTAWLDGFSVPEIASEIRDCIFIVMEKMTCTIMVN